MIAFDTIKKKKFKFSRFFEKIDVILSAQNKNKANYRHDARHETQSLFPYD